MRPQRFLITVIRPWDQYQTRNKTCYQTFFRKRISMLTDLKVSSLVVSNLRSETKGSRFESDCVFKPECAYYRSELTWKWGPHGTEIKFFEIQNWNLSADRAQRVHEKNGVICLVMFTSRIMVIKMSKMALDIANALSAGYSKKSAPVWARYLSAYVRS